VIDIVPPIIQNYGKGDAMQRSQGSNEDKRAARKGKVKASANEPRDSERQAEDEERERLTRKKESTSPSGHVVTEDQYRARVSRHRMSCTKTPGKHAC